jgi:hypothetical protein
MRYLRGSAAGFDAELSESCRMARGFGMAALDHDM